MNADKHRTQIETPERCLFGAQNSDANQGSGTYDDTADQIKGRSAARHIPWKPHLGGTRERQQPDHGDGLGPFVLAGALLTHDWSCLLTATTNCAIVHSDLKRHANVMRVGMKDNLVGIAEIAGFAEVSKQAVGNWRHRYDHFPTPLQQLQSGPVWDRETVEIWVNKFKGEETHVLSFINLKGGVGKTTVAVAVAEILAHEDRKHVLLIDLDPQTNATVTVISEEKWAKCDQDGRTVAQLFSDKLNPHDVPKFDIEKAIVRRVSTVNDGIARLDLLPSSIGLIDLQDRIPSIALSDNFTTSPLEILRGALQLIISRYDYVIIDCPPSLGVITKNGLRISTGYVIPTIPDIVSTWGIYQIVDNVQRFASDTGRSIPPLGIVATKVQANNLHRRVIEDLKKCRLGRFEETGTLTQPSMFESTIPQTVAVARGADVDADLRTFKGKYGNAYLSLRQLKQEIRSACERKVH